MLSEGVRAAATFTRALSAALVVGSATFLARTAMGAPCAYLSAGFGQDAGGVLVLDTVSAGVTPIPLSKSPQGVALAPDGRRVYVVNTSGSSLDTAELAIIDATANQVVLGVPVGNFPSSLSVTPDGRYALVLNKCGLDTTCASPPSIAVVRLDTDQLIGQIFGQQVIPDANCRLNAFAITPDSTRAYVACLKRGQVGIVDLLSFDQNPGCIQCAFKGFMTVTDNTFLPMAVAISPDASRLYVASRGASKNRLSVIDTSTTASLGTLDFDPSSDNLPPTVAVADTGSPVYVGQTTFLDGEGHHERGLLAVDADTHMVQQGISLQGGSALSMALSHDGAHLYVTGGFWNGSFGVDVVDVSTGTSSFLSLQMFGATRGVIISPNDQCG